MKKPNLPASVIELAEMYALGSISLTQVAEEVEKFPLAEQTLMMAKAMIHAERYYREYEKYEEWAAHMNSNGGADLV